MIRCCNAGSAWAPSICFSANSDAKDLKEINPKGRGQALFVAGVFPGFAEKQCSGFDFVPVKTHLVLTK
jgi:hypothetical protein